MRLDIKLYFSDMKDPRIDRRKFHSLEDIVFITIAATICGAESWNEIELFGKEKKEWLSSFLSLPNGIPSHDTFNRFFAILDPTEFETCFLAWVKSICDSYNGDFVSIDGKTMRGSRGVDCKSATHIVSAWSDANSLILGQIKTEQKSNEITAIPELLEALLLRGAIVTIDAMGSQKSIAKKIIAKEADYILAVKENQPELLENIQDSFRFLKPTEVFESVDGDHGRVETRKCTLIKDLSMIEKPVLWKSLSTLVMIESERYFKNSGKTENETRYYISSSPKDAETIGMAIRSHWGIENKVHWSLDVSFGEDKSRKRAGNAAQNYTVVCRIALNLLKKDTKLKVGIKSKRLAAGWGGDYLMELLKF